MKRLAALLLMLASLASASGAERHWASPVRAEHESWEQAWARFEANRPDLPYESQFFTKTAARVAGPLSELNTKELPDWGSRELIAERYRAFRDERFIADPLTPEFPRRISWLFPDDGCFVRAAMVGRLSSSHAWGRPGKLFAFGKLSISTENREKARIFWWYHVAAAVRAGNEVWIIDPAVDPREPLSLQAWLAMMIKNTDEVSVSACSAHTYFPSSPCFNASSIIEKTVDQDQAKYLTLERELLLKLGRDVESELGDRPPWLQ